MDNSELRELLQRATPGEWQQCGHDRGGCACGMVYSTGGDCFVGDFSLSADEETRANRTDADTRKANAALAVAMHAELPRLLADSDELAKLRAEIAGLADCLRHAFDYRDTVDGDEAMQTVRELADALLRLSAGEPGEAA